jgi:chemotaxis response regulator CheB
MANGILIVDDAAFMRMMIKDVLSKNGFEILYCKTYSSRRTGCG